jgi:hypothetical protein
MSTTMSTMTTTQVEVVRMREKGVGGVGGEETSRRSLATPTRLEKETQIEEVMVMSGCEGGGGGGVVEREVLTQTPLPIAPTSVQTQTDQQDQDQMMMMTKSTESTVDPPAFIQPLKDLTVHEGSKVVLECK